MLETFYCFEAFRGTSDTPEWDDGLINDLRKQHPDWTVVQGPDHELDIFLSFGPAIGSITQREAYKVYRKQQIHDMRAGLISFKEGS